MPDAAATRLACARDALARRLTLAQLEELYIDQVLEHTRGNKVQAARILGINRRTLYRRGDRRAERDDSDADADRRTGFRVDNREVSMSRFRTILVPIDFSETAQHALDTAIVLARESGGRVHLLHAYEIPLGTIPPYGVAIPDSLLADVRDAAARRLEKAAHKVEAAGVACETQILHAPPAEGIVEAARACGADLIVMGTRGLTGLRHVLLGSVAERTVRLAPCPVLTVKTKSEASQ